MVVPHFLILFMKIHFLSKNTLLGSGGRAGILVVPHFLFFQSFLFPFVFNKLMLLQRGRALVLCL